MKNGALTTRQQRFAEEFLVDGVAAAAARRAGYAEGSAKQTASNLLTNPYVHAEVARLARDRSERVQFTADDVLRESAQLAMTTMADLVDEDGFIPGDLQDVSNDVLKCVQEVTQEVVTTPDGRQGVRTKIKLYDRLKALALAGKHVNVRAFAETVEVKGSIDASYSQRMDELMSKLEMEEREWTDQGLCPKCRLSLNRKAPNETRRQSPAA